MISSWCHDEAAHRRLDIGQQETAAVSSPAGIRSLLQPVNPSLHHSLPL
jgi:hypothetical protein